MPIHRLVLVALLVVGCGGKATPKPRPSNVHLGSCANPAKDGVLGSSPSLRRADRDLDGDGALEAVVADESLCARSGNCHWNLFHQSRGCWRYLGTVAGATLEAQTLRAPGFATLIGWWRFGGGRSLRQEYRFRHGAYTLRETLICADQSDDRVECAYEGAASPPQIQ